MLKKLKGIVLLAVIIFLIFYYLQFGRRIEIENTRISSFQDGYTEYINLVANKLYITDKDKYAKEVIDTFVDNSFDDVRFSFDLGYPSTLNISVYMNRWNKKMEFEICCIFDIDNADGKPYYYEFEIRE